MYGLNLKNNVGQLIWPCLQAAPAFYQSLKCFPTKKNCLVPAAIDQDVFFRSARDFAGKNKGYIKPSLIHAQFLPSLEGPKTKMSSSVGSETSIFLTDSKDDISRKVKKYAFSGGGETLKEHREKGGNTTIDMSYQYLRYFLDSDDKLLDIKNKYESGALLSSELKEILITTLNDFISNHKKIKSELTPEYIKKFFEEKTF